MNLSQWCRLLCHADLQVQSPLQFFERTVCKVVLMNKVSLLVRMEMNLRCFPFLSQIGKLAALKLHIGPSNLTENPNFLVYMKYIYVQIQVINHHTQYLQMLKTLHAHSNILRCWLLSSIITHLATKNPMCGEAKQRQAMFGYLASIAIAQSWGPSFHSSATSFSWLIW